MAQFSMEIMRLTGSVLRGNQHQWFEFSRQAATARTVPLKSALIDSTSTRVQSGSDMYISRIVREFLDEKERVAVSQAHRKLKDAFKKDSHVDAINKRLAQAAKISRKKVSISVDMSSPQCLGKQPHDLH